MKSQKNRTHHIPAIQPGCNRDHGGHAKTGERERRSRIHLNAVNRPAHRIEYWCTALAEEEVFKRETFGPSSLHLSDY